MSEECAKLQRMLYKVDGELKELLAEKNILARQIDSLNEKIGEMWDKVYGYILKLEFKKLNAIAIAEGVKHD